MSLPNKLKNIPVDMSWIDENNKVYTELEDNLDGFNARYAIALRLKQYMREHKLTQAQLADKLMVTPQWINKVLKGRENLSVDTAIKYGKLLNIKLIQIVGLDEEPSGIYQTEIMQTIIIAQRATSEQNYGRKVTIPVGVPDISKSRGYQEPSNSKYPC